MSDERSRFQTPKPVSAGDKLDVDIQGQGGQGDGIAKVEDFVVFVKGATKGERCRIRITDVKRTYAVGEKIGKPIDQEAEVEMEDKVEGQKNGPAG